MDRSMDSVIGDLIRKKPVRRRPSLGRLSEIRDALQSGRTLDDVAGDLQRPSAAAQVGGVPETPPPASGDAVPVSRLVLNARRFLDASWRAIATRRTPSHQLPEEIASPRRQ